jgi:hypothetical protein
MYYFETDTSVFWLLELNTSSHVDRPHTNLLEPHRPYFEFISVYSLAFFFMLRKT